jgi:hypothetical protein
VWLLLAALYTASILSLIQPFARDEDWPAPPPVNETVRAKQPLAVAPQAAPEAMPAQQVAFVVPTQPKIGRRDEWVQIAGYTTMVRAQPSAASPVLLAYAVGRPLRVIAREAGFARVQDLGSGQFGWIKETSLAPFTGGYRQREDVIAEPQLVASAAPQATVAKAVAVSAKRIQPPRNDAIAARSKKDMVAAIEGGDRGSLGKRRDRPQRIAMRGDNTSGDGASSNDTSFAGLFGRAFRRR